MFNSLIEFKISRFHALGAQFAGYKHFKIEDQNLQININGGTRGLDERYLEQSRQ